MPAAKTISPARLAANRANAQKSTGPRTPEGKARSRANAVKHGLTGAGVALPAEDAAAVEGLFLRIQEELAPATTLGAELAHELALLSVRRRRCARAEAAHLRAAARHAAADFDRDRQDEADRLLDRIEADPRPARRMLRQTPEGVDRLVAALLDLRSDLTGPAPSWTGTHHRRLDALFGHRPDDLPRNRPTRFSRALIGDDDALGPADAAPEEAVERLAWLVERVLEAIDAEAAALGAHRAALDLAAIAEDRADAAERALIAPGREAELARRYASATARELSRALRDFHLAEALAAPEPGPTDAAVEEGPAASPAPAGAVPTSAGDAPAEAEVPPAGSATPPEPSSLPGNDLCEELASSGAPDPAPAAIPLSVAWAVATAEPAPHHPPVRS